MNIVLISYFYPPDTAENGIATYARQAANMLAGRCHHVEVFAGSSTRTATAEENGVLVHRIRVRREVDFTAAIVEKFVERHGEANFDVIEGPDFRAYARAAADACPEIPYVVKLHTPRIISKEYVNVPRPITRLRVKLGELRRGINPFTDVERENLSKADLLASPSRFLGEKLIEVWSLNPNDIVYFPNPYIPSPSLLDIPVATNTERVTFLGRLELRKGVVELAQAVPLVLKQYPAAKFRFVGENGESPDPKTDMREYLIKLLGTSAESVEFVDQVPLDEIAAVFAETDVCVFPSRFDNFPGVCLEAMSAGRGVVGSTESGMTEMLNTAAVGRLVAPENPEAIAAAVVELLQNPERRQRMGAAARQRVLAEYNAERVGEAQERCYEQAIERRRQRRHAAEPKSLATGAV